MSRTYDFTLSAAVGAMQRLDVRGRRVKVLSARAGAVMVKLDGGEAIALDEGQGFTMPDGKSFREVVVSNITGTANSGLLFIGDGSLQDDRVTGVVTVQDGERNKVLAGLAFRAAINAAGGGTQGAHVQLFNPSGSGKNVFVNGVTVGMSAADSWGILATQAQAANVTGGNLANMDAFGPAGVAVGRYGNTTTSFSPTRGYHSGYLSSQDDMLHEFRRPVLLRPGYGLVVYCNTLSTAIRASFDYEEWGV